MFWGFVLEPKKRYNTTVTKPFHISMAALDPKSINDDGISCLVLNVDGTETILCNLGKPNYLQSRLDLNFIEGNTITLEVKGKAIVHLSGYFIYNGMEDDDDSDLEDIEDVDDEEESDIDAKNLKALKKQLKKKNKFNASTTEEEDSEDEDDDESGDDSMDVSDMTFDDEDDDDDEEDDDEDDDDDEEDDDEEEEEVTMGSPGSTPMPPQGKKAKQQQKQQAASSNVTPVSSKKKQQQLQESGKKNKGGKQEQSPQKGMTNGSAPSTPTSGKKKKNKGGQENGGTPSNNPGDKKGATPTPRKSLEGGVIVEDMKVGQGVPAKSGKMVSVFYVGKLKSNNKQFDSTTSGPGFKFRLGKGEVIKGWDVGLNGMKVGGKRRITIPAHMAYGNKGSPPAIPPNSTLVFDVELKNVN